MCCSVLEHVKRHHPQVPMILFISQGSHYLERMADVGFDIISVDWTVDIGKARERMVMHILLFFFIEYIDNIHIYVYLGFFFWYSRQFRSRYFVRDTSTH